jgi:hypothetical protein
MYSSLADITGQLALLPVAAVKDAAVHGKVRLEDTIASHGRAGRE